jgi:hypothetical protein
MRWILVSDGQELGCAPSKAQAYKLRLNYLALHPEKKIRVIDVESSYPTW